MINNSIESVLLQVSKVRESNSLSPNAVLSVCSPVERERIYRDFLVLFPNVASVTDDSIFEFFRSHGIEFFFLPEKASKS